jgi:hypothetical protein
MKSVWNASEHRELQQRVERLTPEHAASWGKMTASQMVVHLTDALRMASGELPVAPKNVPIRYPPLKQLLIYWLPMPKGLPTAPELIARKPMEWALDVAELRRHLDEFVGRGPGRAAAAHPAFGRMSPKLWGVLVYRHMDHHLRQFGV